MSFKTMKLRKNPDCPMCGTHEIKELIDYDQFCGIPKPTEAGPLEVSSHGSTPDQPVVDGIPQMSVEQLKARMDNNTAPFVLDVREPHEYQIVDIGAPLIPVGDLPNQLHRLTFPKTTEIVVHCKSGARSQRAALFLKEQGYTNVSNLAGGILAWADRIDKTLPKY
jgi:adenylyltransferase/sulfurtransferase